MDWHWPQYTMATLLFLTLAAHAGLNGKPRGGNFNLGIALVACAIEVWILWAGGFWS